MRQIVSRCSPFVPGRIFAAHKIKMFDQPPKGKYLGLLTIALVGLTADRHP